MNRMAVQANDDKVDNLSICYVRVSLKETLT